MDASPNAQSEARRAKYALLVTALAPVLPQILGSAFNIWYNIVVVDPLLTTPALKQRFLQTVIVYNSLCYPLCAYAWLRLVYSLKPAFNRLQSGKGIAEATLHRMRRRVIGLPFWGTLICGAGWLLCIPIFLISLGAGEWRPRFPVVLAPADFVWSLGFHLVNA